MLFIVSLLPATIFVVIGYFIVFASTRCEGGLKRFGQYLGGWVLFLAGITVLGGALAPIFGTSGFMDGIAQHMETMSNVEKQQSEILRKMQRD